jgi:Mrp family chromosome partitioning ATPase
VLLLQLRHRRVRHITDVQRGGSTYGNLALLGAVPMILEDRPDTDHDAVAFAVHKIRAKLEIAAAQKDLRILAVTSPAARNGKTSLVMALGISFAGSGSRTLLIDADIIGGGLTARLNVKVRRSIAEIIRRNTHVTEEQLAQATKACRAQRTGLLQKLVEFDFLDHDAALRLTGLHRESSVGLLDALAGDNLNDCVSSTSWPNMFVLPRGSAMSEHSGYISPVRFRRLLEQARAEYDIVLVDTGPILGSIEATMATAAADGTILVVSRGGSADEIRRAANELDASGGTALGVIFNRAKPADILLGGSSTSYRSQAYSPPNGESTAAGPLATALVRASSRRNGESHL